MEELHIKKLEKLINRLLFQSKNFIDYACFPYGLIDFNNTKELNNKFVYDFEYFAFTKSTKSLLSIRKLLKSGLNEDVMIILRSIFENYLSTRYLHENLDETNIQEFIVNPINVAFAFYNIDEEGFIFNRDKDIVGKIKNPSSFKMGRDKKYYSKFYKVLSEYAHCNYGLVGFYKDKGLYSIEKINESLLIRFYVIFIFTKLFELVVTVEGEDFPNDKVEKNCYQLVKDSISLQAVVIDFLRERYKQNEAEELKFHSKRISDMLNEMKKTLSEELGSVDKKDK